MSILICALEGAACLILNYFLNPLNIPNKMIGFSERKHIHPYLSVCRVIFFLQEKAKGTKKKKKIVLAGGGLKAKMKDDFDDYGNVEGGYNDYEDFM